MADAGLQSLRALVHDSRKQLRAWDAGSGAPREFVDSLAATGVLGAMVGGPSAWSASVYAEACRTLARESPSTQTLLTAHGMVCQALDRWGSDRILELLPALATGAELGAFALTDDGAGSDARSLACTATRRQDGWVVSGVKRWVCFGRLASVFLVFAASVEGDVALVVRSSDKGVHVDPELGVRGLATAHLARLRLEEVRLDGDRLLARPGFAIAQVATRALRMGRLCVAAGALAVAESAVETMLGHVTRRRQFGVPLSEFGGVRSLLSQSALAVAAADHCVRQAAQAVQDNEPEAELLVITAKLAATTAATAAAHACAQSHGAGGLVVDSVVDRRVQDARAMEIIEGSTELLRDAHAGELIAAWRQRQRISECPASGRSS